MLKLAIAGLLFLGTSTWALGAEAVLLTPKAAPAPHINGPRVYGCRPGHPLLYRIPATGTRPINFAAEGLPDGLKLDAATGIITGSVARRGEYPVTFRAKNDLGADSRTWKIVCGDTLALTPPMGWNSWYIHYGHVADQHMRDRGRPDDRQRHGRLRLSVRQHRRLLDERPEAGEVYSRPAARRAKSRRGRQHPTESLISPT